MNWTEYTIYIPWLTAGAAGIALLRQMVVMPWISAREKEDRLFREQVDRLMSELDMLRREIRLIAGDLYTLRKDMGLWISQRERDGYDTDRTGTDGRARHC